MRGMSIHMIILHLQSICEHHPPLLEFQQYFISNVLPYKFCHFTGFFISASSLSTFENSALQLYIVAMLMSVYLLSEPIIPLPLPPPFPPFPSSRTHTHTHTHIHTHTHAHAHTHTHMHTHMHTTHTQTHTLTHTHTHTCTLTHTVAPHVVVATLHLTWTIYKEQHKRFLGGFRSCS